MSVMLPMRQFEKPWGCVHLPDPFTAPDGQRIGEIWFDPPASLDSLLVKYLFTCAKLSVQVHPGGKHGKDECWLVVGAEPDALLGVGFRDIYDAETIRAAALDGSIEQMLAWYPVEVGDFYYIPAGTVHAIGAGVSLIEVQQNSDITYRLYDYGRPRELHLEDAVAVVHGRPLDPALRRKLPETGHAALVDGPYFRLDRVDAMPSKELAARYCGPLLVIPLAGEILVAGEKVTAGQCTQASSLEELTIMAGGQCLLAQPCGSGE